MAVTAVVAVMCLRWLTQTSTPWSTFVSLVGMRPSAVSTGWGRDMFGAAGHDITLKMPVGTVISDAQTGDVLFSATVPGETITIAKGGDGGFW